ncbi:MAG: hypothetical protein ABEI13_00385 [Candidatus Paceibacteria bacterium]
MVVQIEHDSRIIAIIVRHTYNDDGVNFFTPSEFSQQLAYMKRPKNEEINAHIHNRVERSVNYTQEVLIIRSGRLRVDFYTPQKIYLHSRILEAGDVILLASGGHGFKVIDDVEMFEIKQGPYFEQDDKKIFDGCSPDQVDIREFS